MPGAWLVSTSSSQQMHEISGEVLDENNNPISSVEVKIYRENQKLDDCKTDVTGKYKLTFGKGRPVDTLSYYHTSYNYATVNGLAGQRDHKINKTLYSLGTTLSPSARLEVISSIHRLMTIDIANKIPPNEIIMKYDKSLKSIDAKAMFTKGNYFELRTKESDIRLMYK
jgi:hypothetical protein